MKFRQSPANVKSFLGGGERPPLSARERVARSATTCSPYPPTPLPPGEGGPDAERSKAEGPGEGRASREKRESGIVESHLENQLPPLALTEVKFPDATPTQPPAPPTPLPPVEGGPDAERSEAKGPGEGRASREKRVSIRRTVG